LFDAGVNNTILHFEKGAPPAEHQPVRVRRWGERAEDFENNAEVLPTTQQHEWGKALFRPDEELITNTRVAFIELGHICYISYGLAVSSDEKKYQGEFVTEDVVSPVKDKLHPKPWAEGKDLERWWVRRVRYLEWGTERAPAKFRRKTFPELHEAREKLLALRIAGKNLVVAYDERQLYSNHTAVSFVPWHSLKGVTNKSISKTARYHHQDPLGNRETREKISRQFDLKYVLAVMNSTFAKNWLANQRRGKLDIYPDDWKRLPIAPIPLEEQKPFVALVEGILREYEKHGYPLPPASAQKVSEWERELDERVDRLYGRGNP
jgi:hypothetical protein